MKHRPARHTGFPLVWLLVAVIAVALSGAGALVSEATITVSGSSITGNSAFDAFTVPGAPPASSSSQLLELGPNSISGGSTTGTFIGINPSSFSGDFLNFEVNSSSVFKVDSAGNVSAGTTEAGIIDKGGQVFNVKAYGAKGDGVNDDTAAIQAAINAAAAVRGTVLFPPTANRYNISTYLDLPEYVNLIGAGSSRPMLYFTGNGDGTCSPSVEAAGYLRIDGRGLNRISGLTLQTANQTAGTCMINIDSVQETSVVQIDHDNIYGGSTQSTNLGIFMYAVDDIRIDHNIIEYADGLIAGGPHTFILVKIQNNVLSYDTNTSTWMINASMGIGNCSGLAVTDNDFEGYVSTMGVISNCTDSRIVGNWFGDPSATGGTWVENGSVIMGNTFEGNGTSVSSIGGAVGLVAGNFFYAPGGVFGSNYGGNPAVLIDNSFYCPANAMDYRPIYNVILLGNYFNSGQYSLYNGAAGTIWGWQTNVDKTTDGTRFVNFVSMDQKRPIQVSSLLTCSSGSTGLSQAVTDSASSTIGATVTELPGWASSTAESANYEIFDGTNVQEVTTSGTTGATTPSWNATVGGTTTDGTVTWTNQGPIGNVLAYCGYANGGWNWTVAAQ